MRLQLSVTRPVNLDIARLVMFVALCAIITVMLLSTQANAWNGHIYGYNRFAHPYSQPHPYAETIAHCGYLKTKNKIYHRGKRNVRIIQHNLEQAGYSVGRHGIDGIYGPDTRRAVRHFQRDTGLRNDAIVGINTSRTLAYESHPVETVRHCRQMRVPQHH